MILNDEISVNEDDRATFLLNECHASKIDLPLLSKSLHHLDIFLQEKYRISLETKKSSFAETIWSKVAMSLLNLEIIETEVPSSMEKKLRQMIDRCLDTCGQRIVLIAAVDCLHKVSTNPAPIIASMRIIRRLLLVSSISSDEECSMNKPMMLQSVINNFALYGDHVSTSDDPNVSVAFIDELVQMSVLIPMQIGAACHKSHLTLPLWAARSNYCPRLIEYSALILLRIKQTEKPTDDDKAKKSNEEFFFQKLLGKMVHHGGTEDVAAGIFQFWDKMSSKKGKHTFLTRAILYHAMILITSPKDCALLILSIIRHSILQIESYPSVMSRKNIDQICRSHCLPFLNTCCLNILKFSKSVRDKTFQQITLSPSRSGDILEHRFLSRIMTILLSQCGDDTNEEIYSDGESVETKLSGITEGLSLDEVSGKSASLKVGTNDEFLNQYKMSDKIGVLMKYLEDTAMIWREPVFIQDTSKMQQNYVTEFILNALDFVSPSCVLEGSDNFIAQELVAGVTERLHAQSDYIRKDGMFVAEKLSDEIHFEELDGERETDIEAKETLNLNLFKPEILNYKNGGTSGEQGKKSTKMPHPKIPLEIDPDEEYLSSDSENMSSNIHVSNIQESRESHQISNNEYLWDEDNFVPYDIEDDEEDLNEVQRPRYLRDCLLLLRASEDDQYSLHKHEVALQEISTLVNAKPYDLPDLAVSLTRQLLFMENKFNLDSFDENRWECLCAVAVNEPRSTVKFLIEEIFGDISLGTRFDILAIIIYSSTYLNGAIQLHKSHISQSERRDIKQPKITGKKKIISKCNRNRKSVLDSSYICEDLFKLEKTQRWGKGNRSIKDRNVTNKFGPLAPSFFYPLVSAFMESRRNDSLWQGSNGAHLISHVLTTLQNLVNNSGNYPGTEVLAKDMFELTWAFRTAENSEVRIAVLNALGVSLFYIQPQNITQLSNVHEGEILEFLVNTISNDSNETCRHLAMKISKIFQLISHQRF